MDEILVGKRFRSFEELQKTIRDFQNKNYVQLWVSHSRTLDGIRKRGVRRQVNSDLKYYEIIYKCIHGGTRKSQSKGQRPSQSTFRQNCPFIIKIKVSSDGDYLEIVQNIFDHNHPCTKERYAYHPRQRQLQGSIRERTKQMLQLRANKKLIQAELLPSTKVTLKDLHNLARTRKPEETESLENALHFLEEKHYTVELVRNEENNLLGMFFQDNEMKRVFSSYPEILFVDAIYKVSDLRIPLYIFAVEDSNGGTEIVAFFLATQEDFPTIKEMVRLFKNHNPSWDKCMSVMTDKDFLERRAFKEEFPNASMLICLFHCMRSFRREVTVEKMGITAGERDACLEILQKIPYTKDEESYVSLFNQLKETGVTPVIQYFAKSWHPIRNEWVMSLNDSLTLGNRTNNRLESINSKVVQVVKRHSKLLSLVKDLDNLLSSLRNERDNILAQEQLKVPLNVHIESEDERKYFSVLTPYAFGFVKKKFKLKDSVQIEGDVNEDVVTVQSGDKMLLVSTGKCSCPFYMSMGLPCHHILKVREVKQVSLFCDSLIANRWTKTYYLNSSRLLLSDKDHEDSSYSISTVKSTRVLTQHDKYRVVSNKAQKLASLASEVPARLFPQRLEVLQTLIHYWENNIEVTIEPVEELITNDQNVNNNDTHLHVDTEPSESVIDFTGPNLPQSVNSIDHELPCVLNKNVETISTGCEVSTETGLTFESESGLDIVNHDARISQSVINIMELEVEILSDEGNDRNKVSHELEQQQLLKNDYLNTAETILDIQSSESTNTFNRLPTLPPKMKKRGRPKGQDKTVIGLPAKKRKNSNVVVFQRKHPKEKQKIMLKWFLSAEKVKDAIDGHIVEKETIKKNENYISCACLDESVHLPSIQKYFTGDAWCLVMQIVKKKENNPLWLCPACYEDSSKDSVYCNSCLEWFHLKCVGLTAPPNRRYWFCRQCNNHESQ